MSGPHNASNQDELDDLADMLDAFDQTDYSTTTQSFTPPITTQSPRTHIPTPKAPPSKPYIPSATPPQVATTAESSAPLVIVLLVIGILLVLGKQYLWADTFFEWIAGGVLLVIVGVGILTLLSDEG